MTTRNHQIIRLACCSVLVLATAANAGTVTGSVTYSGKVPNLKPVSMDADPGCASKHKTAVPSDVLVLGAGGSMANVMVRIKGAPASTAPTTPAVIDQKGCRYEPHVLGVVVGQPVKLRNSDGLLHNVHALPKVNTPFNMAMPANRVEADAKFGKEEGMFMVKCDVHPWMSAYVGVFNNTYFAVTGADGKFSIANVPAGTYDLEAWHEKLGTKTAKITVGASGSVTSDFAFAPPAN